LADFSGRLSRIDEPIRGVDAPVFYFTIDDRDGFGVHAGMFRNAEWQTVGGERSVRIELDGVVITVAPDDRLTE
jgi:hypothetical protein